MPITEQDVDNIAELARLELTPQEKAVYRGQLESILKWMEKLNELDTSGIEPTAHVSGAANPLREDTPVIPDAQDAIIANAPGKQYNFIKVRKVIE